MDRRNFLKYTAAAGASFALSQGLGGEAFAKEGPLVVSSRGPDPGKITRDAMAALGTMASFVAKGDTVVVKPNIGWDRKPEQAANTHPEVVRELVKMCLEAGAAKVKVFDRTCNDPRRCYVNSGIAQILEEMADPRVIVSQIDDRRFREVELSDAFILKKWSYYEEVLDADKFINVPIAKHHSSAGVTMGMKNVMGVIGSNRAILHRNLHEALVDMNRVVRSHLTVIDATRILVANGPQGGRLEDVVKKDMVIASADVVAADTVSARLFNKTPRELKYLDLAHARGIGVADMNLIRLKEIGG